MKILRVGAHIAAIACLALASACATASGPGTSGPPGGVYQPPPVLTTDGTVLDEQALFAVEAAYNVAATAYLSADGRGQIPATTKAEVRPIMASAYEAVLLARAAYRIGDASTFTAQAAAAIEAATRAAELIPK
jgi:hypothetical protein